MNQNDIWVVCTEVSQEMTAASRLVKKAFELSRIKQVQCAAVCFEKVDQIVVKQLSEYGADYVLTTDESGSAEWENANILKQMITCYAPQMILFLGNCFGKYLAAVCSAAFDAALTADCIDISLSQDGAYIFSRAALNDSVIANIKAVHTTLQMCTVKENTLPDSKGKIEKECRLVPFPYHRQATPKWMEVQKRMQKTMEQENQDWQNAKTIFVVGRGVSRKRDLERIYELAKEYQAVVAGTRAAVEAGLIEEKRQVGQSGYSISPEIYVGFGVSGACQHIVGMKNARTVIAINQDRNAPIFEYADYKIVSDVETFLQYQPLPESKALKFKHL